MGWSCVRWLDSCCICYNQDDECRELLPCRTGKEQTMTVMEQRVVTVEKKVDRLEVLFEEFMAQTSR